MRQNHPELVVRDIVAMLGGDMLFNEGDVRRILKNRGINKWLHVRRMLIELKHRWKEQINKLEDEKLLLKTYARLSSNPSLKHKYLKKAHKLTGYVEALKDMRQQVRALCHSPRDIDFPESPRDYGEGLPANFPLRPHKRFLWKREYAKPTRRIRRYKAI